MFTFEKDGVRMSVESDIQASAFLSCGWKPVEETVKGFKEILEGKYDDLPEDAFRQCGPIEDVVEKAKKMTSK